MESTVIQRDQLELLPHKPGVYKYYNADKKIIYVGKAKDLRKRVSSYFNKSLSPYGKTGKLVKEIAFIDFSIVDSEIDALLLENNLIKTYQPRYNIMLRDDKSYPYICITNERFPKIFPLRNIHLHSPKNKYFGPYGSVGAMKAGLELIKSLFPIRTCNLNLSEENIKNEKFKVCLEYHLGNCLGPCEGLQAEEDYNKDIEQAINILKGNFNQARIHLKANMKAAAENLAFEQAEQFKNKLGLLEKYQSKSVIINPKLGDVDVFAIISDEKNAFLGHLKLRNGAIIATKTSETKKQLDEADEEVLEIFIANNLDVKNENTTILSNIELTSSFDGKVFIPKAGDKKKLLDLAVKNALYHKNSKLNQQHKTKEKHLVNIKMLQGDLRLRELPEHIECFDNSNIQGTNPVASMVCFRNGKPSKNDYRKFNIKSVEGPDDFASMKEVVTRRYSRLLDEGQPLPHLIVIDGGKGQLNAAVEALKGLNIYNRLAIVGIAKRLEEIYFPEDPLPIYLPKKSESLKLLQHLRNEAHRFAITFHRSKRSKALTKSELADIPGIGPKTIEALLKHFKSLKQTRLASKEEIAQIVGQQKAQKLTEAFKEEPSSNN